MIITRQKRANRASERWKEHYFHNGQWFESITGCTSIIYTTLLELGENPEPEAVNKAIGNDSWTDVQCNKCIRSVDSAAVIIEHDQDDYFILCNKCLHNAIDEMEAGE